MKHIYIHCDYLPAADYRMVLEQLCPASVRDITVYTRFPVRVTAKQIESVVQVQKDFSCDRAVRFQNYAVFAELPRFSKALRKALRKNSFLLELQVQKHQVHRLGRIARRLEKATIGYKFCLNETEDQLAAYRLFAKHRLSVCFAEPRYTAQSPELFEKWLYDPSAQGVNTFCDIINMLLLQSHSPNCRHASCFGNTFFVDGQLHVYLCPFHPDARTKLGTLSSKDGLETLLNSEAVANLLPAAVQKRQHCAEKCSAFPHCQGGCPLSAQTNTECGYYSATVERIAQSLLSVYREGKVSQVNYIVKNAILNALAFGTAFLTSGTDSKCCK